MTRFKHPFTYIFLFVVIMAIGKWHSSSTQRNIAKQDAVIQPLVDRIIADSTQPFSLPMASSGTIQEFGEFGKVQRFANLYHSATDYYALPGTEVFAVADGIVYFSGHEPAYGGLVIVEHPDQGLYSLYGHVSARQWLISEGAEVKKGDRVGYIAETNEGYGIGTIPHLHFSIRLGSPSDYPKSGRENWMTGYTAEHPLFHQFVDPDRFIAQSRHHHKQAQQ